MTITIETAAAVLEALGSGDDPVRCPRLPLDESPGRRHDDPETTPMRLSYSTLAELDARKVRVDYHGVGGRLVRGGTLVGMIRDRLRCEGAGP